MGASVIVNTLLAQGSLGGLAERFRHWGAITRPAPTGEALPSDHTK
jgi:hypothetical protein